MSKETCHYSNKETGKKCGTQLGPWQPSGIKVQGTSDVMERTCEKCGGQQTRFHSTDPKVNRDIGELFSALEGKDE